MNLSKAHKKLLLQVARQSIEAAIRKARPYDPPSMKSVPELNIKCGVFVSVYVNGELRGCIGTFSEEEPLVHNVREMAVSAATQDTRFKPVQPEELGNMQIEISVLSPRKPISDINEIEPGKHGIYIKKGLHRGTLLPQVAIAQNWDVYEFLGNCAKYKAGIGWDGWKTAEIYIYEAFVFHSGEIES